MYRKIFTPDEQNNHIPFTIPQEWYGQRVEFIVFPLAGADDLQAERPAVQNRRKKREEALNKYLTDLSGFKFNRDEANDYD